MALKIIHGFKWASLQSSFEELWIIQMSNYHDKWPVSDYGPKHNGGFVFLCYKRAWLDNKAGFGSGLGITCAVNLWFPARSHSCV